MQQPDTSLREQKRAIRRAMLDRRDGVPADEREDRSKAATVALLALPELSAAPRVAGFVSTRSEIDTSAALSALRERGTQIILPRVGTGLVPPRLRFHVSTDRSQLVSGLFGLLEPSAECAEILPASVDVFLVPGLAFDKRGARIGYGGGYYDEIIASIHANPGPVRPFFVGFAFDFQVIDTCPSGEWDVPIDCIVTDERVIRCQGNQEQGIK